MTPIYFDNAATTAIRPEVLERMINVMREVPGNPSSSHAVGRKAKSLIENARKTVATFMGVTAAEIIFTSGGTEADNLVLNSAVRDLGVKHLITSPTEHHAVLHIVEQLEKEYKDLKVSYVKIKECGSVDTLHLGQLLASTDDKTLVSLMHVNNEVGNILDVEGVGKLCKQYGAYFHSDMVQSVGHYDLKLKEIPVNFMAASAHKFHGPKGVGFAYIEKNSGLKPMIFGGGQERGARAGTESVHNIVGLEEALKYAYKNLDEERRQIESIKAYFVNELSAAIPDVKYNGNCADNSKSTYTLVNACLPIPPEKSLMLLFQLDLKGIACSKGSACQSGSDQGSHVLEAFLNEEDKVKPSVRFSFSHYNTKKEVDYVVKTLKEFIED
ncbi:cysteine desulfurase family protein [Leeuwenhoekiella sp. A16]|uniref:cysteine desulfurase family protein n=1 Tax=unclassified Leeuwenhoekiella TaxID=2615029 RepID=UPI003A7FCC23